MFSDGCIVVWVVGLLCCVGGVSSRSFIGSFPFPLVCLFGAVVVCGVG